MSQPYAYLRKSSVRDPAKDTSPETQEREVRALAARHDQTIADDAMLADWDVSGRDEYTSKREGYLRLVEAIAAGEVSVVYSYSLSRLGRSTPELSKLFILCGRMQVPLRLVVDAVDTSTASGRMMANVLSAVAQFEAEVASERLLAMYAMKRAKALEAGEDPFEAVRSSPRYGEKPGQDPDLVMRVFLETGSYSRTARRLNDDGVPARDGGTWWASSVGAVLERIDPSLKALKTKHGGRAGPSSFALSKLLRCPQDGAMLTGSHIPATLKDGTAKVWTRYSCRHGEAVKHPRVSIAEHLIMSAIESEAALYRDPTENDGGDAEARRQSLLDRRRRAVEMRLDGLITREEASVSVAEIDSELTAMAAPKPRDLRLVSGWTPSEVNSALRSLFESIELDPDTLQPITFKWRHPEWRDVR